MDVFNSTLNIYTTPFLHPVSCIVAHMLFVDRVVCRDSLLNIQTDVFKNGLDLEDSKAVFFDIVTMK